MFALQFEKMENPILAHSQGFPKSERLCSQKVIKELFSKGSSLFVYPFKILYLPASTLSASAVFPQVMFSVPKKNFKRAVDRNRIKRQCREIYRLCKSHLFSEKKPPQALAIIFVAQKQETFEFLQKKMEKVLEQMP